MNDRQRSFLAFPRICPQPYNALVSFVALLRASVPGKAASESPAGPPAVSRLCDELDGIAKWVTDIPPLDQPMRFGNQAFRTWHKRLIGEAAAVVSRVCGPDALPGCAPAAPSADGEADEWAVAVARWQAASAALGPVAAEAACEAQPWQRAEAAEYLWDAFGNASRVDYGTGHETTFVLFLLALDRAGAVDAADRPTAEALVLRAMPRYLAVCRRLQQLYQLEPAGSHGVWSLDDFHLLSFALGSAQMRGAGSAKAAWQLEAGGSLDGFRPGGRAVAPRVCLDDAARGALRQDWLLAEAVAGVCECKSGAPFSEHSPRLHDVLRMTSWGAAESSLFGTWQSEVPGKRPVAQGLLFSARRDGLWPVRWEASGEATDRRREEGEARVAAMGVAGAAAGPDVATRAPWASGGSGAAAGPDVATRAPWASGESSSGGAPRGSQR